MRALARTLKDSTALRSIERIGRFYLHSTRAGLRALERRYTEIPAVKQMADMLATDPGTDRVVGETLQTAAEGRARAMLNRMRNAVGGAAEDTAGWNRLRDLLTGTARLPRSAAEAEAVKRLRTLLDEQHDYLKKAGVDLGMVRGRYFPRIFDGDKILRTPDAFKADAMALYRKLGLSADDAARAADDWLDRLAGVGRGAAEYGHTPTGNYTKGRQLPADADKMLAEWMVTDPRLALTTYFERSSRQAEFVRRFGANGAKAEEMFTAMRDRSSRIGRAADLPRPSRRPPGHRRSAARH